ncbi:serine/arginine repetitive matrix protein 2-like [Vidua chalybeata]|uniref:serine/arginine repetitive matrix protein 2-like n=1 Tax=Vidua chalybeata TaxID=81927 RepID=UPI0023A90DCC|nr:serine/arginine repetitive matrix protein 2-like [Vidua chalybeata]XP_053816606.1 serine/arginine repetitive matrix protein 2-like [Vidua chalybeata]XP_053816607.1 serine/arginine repetitive matrix protein 2-like [Vidua chalybeata]
MRLQESRGKPDFSRQNHRLFPPLESGGVPVRSGASPTPGSSRTARALPSPRRDGRTDGQRERGTDRRAEGGGSRPGGRNYKSREAAPPARRRGAIKGGMARQPQSEHPWLRRSRSRCPSRRSRGYSRWERADIRTPGAGWGSAEGGRGGCRSAHRGSRSPGRLRALPAEAEVSAFLQGQLPSAPGAAGTSLCQRWGRQDRSGTCPLGQGKAPEPGFGPGWFLCAGIPSPEPRLGFGCSLLSAAGNGTAVPPAPPKSRGFTAFGIVLLRLAPAQGISRGTDGKSSTYHSLRLQFPLFLGYSEHAGSAGRRIPCTPGGQILLL